jgi:hypothetical protein
VFLYLARTNFLQLFLVVCNEGLFLELLKDLLKLSLLLYYYQLWLFNSFIYINPKRNGDGIEAFKIKVAPSETFKSKLRDDYKDFNDHYRALRNIMTIRQVSKEVFWMFIWKGLGSRIDLRQKISRRWN